MLGLADEVGRDVTCVRGGIGEDRDLGRARLGIDADQALEEPLGSCHIDVAGTGHQGDRLAVIGRVCRLLTLAGRLTEAVGEASDGLGPTHRIDLIDPEQGTGREDRRVWPAVVVLLGRGRDGEGAHLRELGRDDIHDDAARIDREAAGDVETHPIHGDPALGDRASRDDLGDGLRAALVGVHEAGPPDRLLERGSDRRVQGLQCVGNDLGRDPEVRWAHAVEALSGRVEGLGAALTDVLADGAHRLQGRLDVELGPRQGGAELPERGLAATQVEHGEHVLQSKEGVSPLGRPSHPRPAQTLPNGAPIPAPPGRPCPNVRGRRRRGHRQRGRDGSPVDSAR